MGEEVQLGVHRLHAVPRLASPLTHWLRPASRLQVSDDKKGAKLWTASCRLVGLPEEA